MKRIIVVAEASEQSNGVRALLQSRHGEWHMDFVESGAAAIGHMEKQPYDLLCSDIQSSPLDGIQLLTKVAQRWPQTVRVVLSGYSQSEQEMQLVQAAHQYLNKPCEANRFDNVLSRSLRIQDTLARPSLRTLVGRVKKLPPLPRIYAKLRSMMSNPNVSTTDIAKIVAEDAAISAKVLQVVNSAFFRLSRTITKVEQAVSYLGLATVRNLVLSVEVFSLWNKSASKGGIDAERMQADAMFTAAVARALAQGTPLVDDALVAGLLRDIGYLVLGAECPDDLRRASKLSSDKLIPLHEAERATLGASHAEVGAYMLAFWGFPYAIVEAVAYHHEPNAVTHAEFDLLGILAATTALTSATQDPAAAQNSPIDDAFFKSIHAPFTLSEAQERVREVKAAGSATAAL